MCRFYAVQGIKRHQRSDLPLCQEGRAFVLYAQGILCAGFMLFCSLKGGILAIAAALGVFWYYYRKTKKELGGITGDTAGYFVVICETAILAAEAVVSIL